MGWLRIGMAFVVSTFVASFTDWYFFGVLFHDRYLTTPGIWKRYKDKRDEMRSIWISEAVLSLSSAVFILACTYARWTTFSSSLIAAFVIWLMVPLPLLVTNAIYIPMDKLIVVSHSLGWLARLSIAALSVAWLV